MEEKTMNNMEEKNLINKVFIFVFFAHKILS